MARTVGTLVREARLAAGLSLRGVAGPLGVSVPFIHDVEHDRRRLGPARWVALVAILPGLSVRDLAVASLATGPVEIDARDLTEEQRARFVEALEHAARAA